jgi:cytochrome c-type biogenesis protein CcmH
MTADPAIFDPPPDSVAFYTESLQHLVESGIPFMLSGTYALGCHTGIVRPTKDLAKDHEGAIRDWLALLADTPPGAPWEADLRRTIEQVGKINDIDVSKRLAAIKPAAPHPSMALPSVATSAIPGPSREQMQAAAALPKGQQDQMVDGMVASLEGKLKANPGNIDGWIMLMRSRMTLGENGKAAAALNRALAANPAQAGRIRDEARILGVPGA